MSKRKYTHMKELEMQILSMRESGMTRQEIADELGLEKGQIKNWIARYNRRSSLLLREPKQKAKGRPRKDGQPPKQDIRFHFFQHNFTPILRFLVIPGIVCIHTIISSLAQ